MDRLLISSGIFRACLMVLLAITCTNRSPAQFDTRTQPSAEEMAAYAKAYAACKNGMDKRQLCLDLIDKQVVTTYIKLTEVLPIFGSDYEEMALNKDGTGYGIVSFEPIHPAILPANPGDPFVPSWRLGWYLVLYFNSHGAISDYHLRNLHRNNRP